LSSPDPTGKLTALPRLLERPTSKGREGKGTERKREESGGKRRRGRKGGSLPYEEKKSAPMIIATISNSLGTLITNFASVLLTPGPAGNRPYSPHRILP